MKDKRQLLLSVLIIIMFSGIIIGTYHAMHVDKEISNGWKEILFLMIGTLISSFSKVVDYWFKNEIKPPKINE